MASLIYSLAGISVKASVLADACKRSTCSVKENIFLKLRQRKPGRLGQYQKFDEVQHEFEVEENGLKFIINLRLLSRNLSLYFFWL